MREDANVTIIVPLTDDDVSHVSAFMQRYVTLICGQTEMPDSVPGTSVAFVLYGTHQGGSYSKVHAAKEICGSIILHCSFCA